MARVFLFVMLAGCGGPLGPELFVHGTPLSRADALVVLGNRPPTTAGGQVAPETERRVRRAALLYGEGVAPLFIITGSQAEAPGMLARARELGVPRSAIRIDSASSDTADNARNSVRLACQEQERAECTPRLIVVSSPYHLQRAERLFACAGADTQVAATEFPDDRMLQISFTAYEYAVRFAYVFYDACARARADH